VFASHVDDCSEIAMAKASVPGLDVGNAQRVEGVDGSGVRCGSVGVGHLIGFSVYVSRLGFREGQIVQSAFFVDATM